MLVTVILKVDVSMPLEIQGGGMVQDIILKNCFNNS